MQNQPKVTLVEYLSILPLGEIRYTFFVSIGIQELVN